MDRPHCLPQQPILIPSHTRGQPVTTGRAYPACCVLYLQFSRCNHAAGNELSGTLPAALGATRGLTFCNLEHNAIGGTLPASYLNLPKLRVLDLVGATVRSCTDSVKSFRKLQG